MPKRAARTKTRSKGGRKGASTNGFVKFLTSTPVRRLIIVAIFVVVLFLVWPYIVSAGDAAWQALAGWTAALWANTLSLFGAGLIIMSAALGTLLWAVFQPSLKPVLRHWNIWVAVVLFGIACWGLLAFFRPGTGVLSHSTLGGMVGKDILGSADIFGALRLAVLVLIGVFFITPGGFLRVVWSTLRLAVKAVGLAVGRFRRPARQPAEQSLAAAIAVGEEPLKKSDDTESPKVTRLAAPAPGKPPAMAKAPTFTAGGWQLPPIDILDQPVEVELSQTEIKKRAQLIEEALGSYGVEGKVVQINVGPAVTQFGVEPGWDHKYKEIRERDDEGNVTLRMQEISKTRVKVERIANLANDLSLALAASTIRIEAPVPGKSVVGIEVPNTTFGLVNLRSVIETTVFQKIRAKSKLALALGKGAGGETVAADLTKMPHLLVAGATGSGKTACLNSMIASILLHNTPDDVRFVMIDPKRVELTSFNEIPHLLAPVVVEADKAVKALRWLTMEMDRRYRLFADQGARNIEAFNKDKQTGEAMPYVVLIVDELADLMIVASDEVEHTLCRLAQLARATGIHLVVATQRPSVDVITGLIKANFPTRISFAVTSQVDSRTILDTVGAEKLLGRGDMLYMPTDAAKPKRLQGTFLSDAEIDRVVSFWGNQRRLDMIPVRFEDVGDGVVGGEKGPDDALLEEARQLARQHNERISTSFLQRHLRIGYPRAARLAEILQKECAQPADGDHKDDIQAPPRGSL